MNADRYIGHPSQLYGIEEHRLVGGRGDGMRLLEVKNGLGLEMTVLPDRCADISRLTFRGYNMGYFSANGYVSPAYYSDRGNDFLKSFTAGFLTTCGLTAVGTPCTDGGEDLPLHGTIGNTPCDRFSTEIDDDALQITAQISDARIFGHKLQLTRRIRCARTECSFTVTDTVRNRGTAPSPLMLLYHMNMGYPLLSEHAMLEIPSEAVTPRDAHAAEGLTHWAQIPPPTAGFVEQCYYHSFAHGGRARILNPDIGCGLEITFGPELDCFTQWKLMDEVDYVLGLEPGNCLPDGRDVMRRTGRLKTIAPGEAKTYSVHIALFEPNF